MNKISAKVIADSKNEFGNRITTLEVIMPRIVLAEFNTHRMFSRNSASSRAIPFKKMVEAVQINPFIPIAWQKDHKGMQGTKYITKQYNLDTTIFDWLRARDEAIRFATVLNLGFEPDGEDDSILVDGVTKQLCNRLLEPFMYHKVIITATEFENFFNLRCPQYFGKFRSWKDASNLSGATFETLFINRINNSQAEIHIQAVAECMWDAMNESTPKLLEAGEWHIPYGDNITKEDLLKYTVKSNKFTITGDFDINFDNNEEFDKYFIEQKVKIAVARCARVSYTVVGEEGKAADYAKDIILYDRLAESGHWSPFEHVAKAMSSNEAIDKHFYDGTKEFDKYSYGWCNNFRGFIQHRYLLEKIKI